MHIQLTTATYYPLAIACGAEAIVAIKRIEEYLLLDENTTNNNINTCKKLIGELTQIESNMTIKMNSTIGKKQLFFHIIYQFISYHKTANNVRKKNYFYRKFYRNYECHSSMGKRL